MENQDNPLEHTNAGDVNREQENSGSGEVHVNTDAKVNDENDNSGHGHKTKNKQNKDNAGHNLTEIDMAASLKDTSCDTYKDSNINVVKQMESGDENDNTEETPEAVNEDDSRKKNSDENGELTPNNTTNKADMSNVSEIETFVKAEDLRVTNTADIAVEENVLDEQASKTFDENNTNTDVNRGRTSDIETCEKEESGIDMMNRKTIQSTNGTKYENPICEPCREERLYNEAQLFCENCNQYLCKNCTNFHKKLFASKSHRTLEGESLLHKVQSHVHSKDETYVIKPEKICSVHPNNKIEYFCTWDLQLCCKTCVDIEHETCKVSYIPVASENIETSQELKKVVKAISSVGEQFNTLKGDIEKKRADATKCHDSSLKVFRKFRNNIDKYLQNLEETFTNEEQAIHTVNIEKLNKVEAIVNNMFTDYSRMKECIEKKRVDGHNSQLFISMKQTESEMRSMQNQLRELTKDFSIIRYVFKEAREFESFMKTQLNPGEFLKCEDFESVTATFDETLSITGISFAEIQSSKTSFTGIEYLESKKLLITGWSSSNIFLIDLNAPQISNIVSRLLVSATPYDVISIEENKVAVTIPDDKKIQVVSVQNDTLILEEEIAVGDHCYGIAKTGTSFVVTFPKMVKIMDQSGNVLKEITAGVGGVELSDCPMYVAVDPEGSSIYLSDGKRNIITRLSIDGSPLGFYMNSSLIKPRGLVVDENGFVFVCGQKSNNIHCFSPELIKGKVVLGPDDDLVGPTCLSYSKTGRKLYIGRQYPIDKKLKVFSLSKALQPLRHTENAS